MRLLDDKGRLFGVVNVIDLAVVAILCAVAAAAYVRISGPGRPAQPYALETSTVTAIVDLRLPADRVWLGQYIEPGLQQIDPRTGGVVAEISAKRTDDAAGGLVVTVRLRAVRDGRDRLLYGDGPLVPGRKLTVETPACHIEGIVSEVRLEP
jgi:hypothetical protein